MRRLTAVSREGALERARTVALELHRYDDRPASARPDRADRRGDNVASVPRREQPAVGSGAPNGQEEATDGGGVDDDHVGAGAGEGVRDGDRGRFRTGWAVEDDEWRRGHRITMTDATSVGEASIEY